MAENQGSKCHICQFIYEGNEFYYGFMGERKMDKKSLYRQEKIVNKKL